MSFLNKVFAAFDEHEALQDRARALARLRNAQAEAASAAQRADAAARDYATIDETITAWERWSRRNLTPDQGSGNGNGENGEGTGGRAAIRKLLAGHPRETEWTTPSVANALGLDKKHHHAVQVHLSRLARDDELVRPQKGVYTLPPKAPTVEGEEAKHGDTGAATGLGVR